MKKAFLYLTVYMLIFLTVFCQDFSVVSAKNFTFPLDKDGKLIIAIDPGHGGTNEGAKYHGTKEKYVTVKIAEYMKEELEKYEDVKVIMTHTDPEKSIEIKTRVENAAKAGADFYFSLHMNASTGHKFFGSEVWIPASDDVLAEESYKFATMLLPEFEKLGIFSRGIKTKTNPSNTSDYYGVMRFCEKYNMPSCIIEHCHMDNDEDLSHWEGDEKLKALGVADATAVAKYFGLKSAALNVDYSGTQSTAPKFDRSLVKSDVTRPDECRLTVNEVSSDGEARLTVTASDEQTMILYYRVSHDGGLTYEPMKAWTGADALNMQSPKECEITVSNVKPDDDLYVRVYNKYDVDRISNVENMVLYFVEEESEPEPVYVENRIAELRNIRYMKYGIIAALSLLVVLIITWIFVLIRRKKKRKQRRNRLLKKRQNRDIF